MARPLPEWVLGSNPRMTAEVYGPCRLGLPGCLGVLDAGVAGQRVVHEFEFLRLQALDLVAQAGGGFEVEVGGGVAHLAFQRLEMGLQVGADQRALVGGDTLCAGNVGADVVALVDAIEDVGDVGLDRLRRDAVFLVVGELLLAAAVRSPPWRAASSR
jgi:hypothetical protein